MNPTNTVKVSDKGILVDISTLDQRRVFNTWEHSSWGNSINIRWDDADEETGTIPIHGHYRTMTNSVKVGDKLRLKFESGKIGEVEVKEVEYKRDPPDMFFGKAEWIDYVPPSL